MRNNSFFSAATYDRFIAGLRLALLFTLIMSSTGCPFFSGPTPASLEAYKLSSPQEAKEFLSAYKKRDMEFHSARGRFEVEITKGFRRERATQVFAFERPNHLRVELFATSLNQLMLMLVAKEGIVEALDPKEGVLYRALPTPASIFKLLGVPLIPEELELWMSGMALIPDVENVSVLRNRADGTYGIETDANFGRILRARFASDLSEGPKMISFELGRVDSYEPFFFSELQYEPSEHIPSRITFHLPDQGVQGELVRKIFLENPGALPAKLFQIPGSENMHVEAITEDPEVQ